MRKLIIFIALLLMSIGLSNRVMEAATEITQTITIIEEEASIEEDMAGTYPITIKYKYENGNTAEKTIYVTILFPRTIESSTHSEAIDARDLQLSRGGFNALSDEELKSLSQARAWSTKDGGMLDITLLERITVDSDLGIYKVLFSTANNTTTTINVIERDIIYTATKEFYIDLLKINRINWIEYSMVALMILPPILLLLNYGRMNREIQKVHKLLHYKEIQKTNKTYKE